MAKYTLNEFMQIIAILRRMAGVTVTQITRKPDSLIGDIHAGSWYTLGVNKDGQLQIIID